MDSRAISDPQENLKSVWPVYNQFSLKRLFLVCQVY